MAVGKNKRLSKSGKKGGSKKKVADVMTKKEWYDVVAPAYFTKRTCAKTMVNRTAGNKSAAEALKGRIFEVSLGDLNEDEQQAFRKIYLRVDEVQGRSCLTNFHGMRLTTDKLRSLVRKWCTLIEAAADFKTTDGYTIRVFVVGFTKRRTGQVRKNCYAQTTQVHRLKHKMYDILRNTITKNDLSSCVQKFQHELIGKDIERMSNMIYPLRDVFVRKVKLIKCPKYDYARLMDVHGGSIPVSREDIGVPIYGETVAAPAPAATPDTAADFTAE
jgi:small subunit ribosomal protein S3Ae